MAGIKQISDRQDKWRQERPESGGGSGQNYYPRTGDIVFFYFMSTGEDDDPYMEVFWSHEIPAQQQGRFSTYKYCPVQSEHNTDYKCAYCDGTYKLKKRMMIWMYVVEILQTQLREGEQLPTVNWRGRNYFKREVNEVRLWDTSAWRESPLDDIINLASQIGNLHAFMFELHAVGEGLQRRYKVYIQQGSQGFPAAAYQKGKETAQPLRELLADSIAEVPTEQRPETVSVPSLTSGPAVAAYTPPTGFTSAPAPVPAPTPMPNSGSPQEDDHRRLF